MNAGVQLPIEVETRYERFPASLKGAFVLRGADGNPHAVQIAAARVARIPGGPGQSFPVETRIIDVAPRRDLFVPFEAPVSDTPPGWYVVESTMKVDGGGEFVFASRPFAIPWPRNDVRRGTIPVERKVRVGKKDVRIDRIEMGGDAAAVIWWPEGEGPPDVAAGGTGRPEAEAILIADGDPLDILPAAQGWRSGRGELRSRGEHRTISYPVPRSARSLAVMVRVASGGRSESIQVALH